jgi:hypothetical protein
MILYPPAPPFPSPSLLYSIFERIKQAKEIRRQKVIEYNNKNAIFGKVGTAVKNKFTSTTTTTAAAAVAPVVAATQPVIESVPEAAVSSPETKTLTDQVASFADNIVNPENHPDEPVTKQSSDDPTEEDDEESQEDLDNEDKDEAGESTAEPPSPINNMSPISPLLDQIKSEDGNTTTVETFSPPNSIKPMEKEDVEKFIAEQKAQANTGLLCGCI